MKKCLFKKKITCLLILVLLTASTNTFAQSESKKLLTQGKNKNTNNEPYVVKELKEYRTTNSTTYLLSDGSRKIEMSEINTRYEENGKLIDYNPDLKKLTDEKEIEEKVHSKISKNKLDEYVYSNIAGDAKHYFPKELGENKGILMVKDDCVISFAPVMQSCETDDVVLGQYQNAMKTTETADSRYLENSEVEENSISYINKQMNVEYKYTSYSSYLKEEIILSSIPSDNKFEFLINIPNMKIEIKEANSSIQIIDEKTNNSVAYIAQPNIKSKNRELSYDDVKYEIEKQQDEKYILRVVVDEHYLNSPNTEYPVIIDPTVVWIDSYLESATVSSFSGNVNTNIKNTDTLEVQYYGRNFVPFKGTEFRSYIKTTGSPLSGSMEQFYGSKIESAELKIVEHNDLTSGAGIIEVRTPESSWNINTITWNNQPEVGSRIWSEFSCEGIKNKVHYVDLTDWAQAIADKKINNYGLILKAKEKGTRVYFYSSSFENVNYMRLSIIYWPYSAEVNNYYDNAYNVRYSQSEFGEISPLNMIKGNQSWVNSILGQIFGLKIDTNTPELYTSLSDVCKYKQGKTINTTTIEQLCPGGEGHGFTLNSLQSYDICSDLQATHLAFISDKPSTKMKCEVLWSGNTYSENANWSWYNSIVITWKRAPATRYEAEKRTLLHELGHYFGAPDEYCGNSNLPKDQDCGIKGCPIHHPERNDGDCIMGTAYYDSVTRQAVEDLFCKYCKANEPTGIPYHLELYHKAR